MRTTSMLIFIILYISISLCGSGIKERRAIYFPPFEKYSPEAQIPSVEYARAQIQTNVAGPNEGIVIGTTDYDLAFLSGFAKRIVSYNNGEHFHMAYIDRDFSLASPSNQPTLKYVNYKPSNGAMTSGYPFTKSLVSSGFGGIDVIPAGPAANIAVLVSSFGGKTYVAIDASPGAGQFSVNVFPDSKTNFEISNPQVTVSSDGTVIWLTGIVSQNDCIVARSTDFGSTWIGIDSLKKFLPHSGFTLNRTSSPLLLGKDGALYRISTLEGKGALPPIGSAHPDSADCIGYFKSTNNGTSWIWTTIGQDGEPLVVAPGDTVYSLFENFAQFSGVIDEKNVLHIVSNGYCLKWFSDTAASNRFYTLYYKDGSIRWKIISNPNQGNYSDFDSSYYNFSGNAIGFPYPTIAVLNSFVFVFWSQPIFNAGRLDTTGGRIQYRLWKTYSMNDGGTFLFSAEVPNSTGGLFPFAANNIVPSASFGKISLLYLGDTVRGTMLINVPPVKVPWIYREFIGPIAGLDKEVVEPRSYSLSQNFPNPFNPSTSIRYGVLMDNDVTIEVFDLLGRKVKILVSEYKSAGEYTILFDGSRFSSGIYYYRMRSGSFSSVKKMVLQK